MLHSVMYRVSGIYSIDNDYKEGLPLPFKPDKIFAASCLPDMPKIAPTLKVFYNSLALLDKTILSYVCYGDSCIMQAT
jgi:hypothetical protein